MNLRRDPAAMQGQEPRTLTARAAMSRTTAIEMIESASIDAFARRVSGIDVGWTEGNPVRERDVDVVLEPRIPAGRGAIGRPVLREEEVRCGPPARGTLDRAAAVEHPEREPEDDEVCQPHTRRRSRGAGCPRGRRSLRSAAPRSARTALRGFRPPRGPIKSHRRRLLRRWSDTRLPATRAPIRSASGMQRISQTQPRSPTSSQPACRLTTARMINSSQRHGRRRRSLRHAPRDAPPSAQSSTTERSMSTPERRAAQHSAEKKPGDHELRLDRDPAGTVEARDPMAREELPPAGPGQPNDVLDVGCGRRHRADGRRVERATHDRKRQHAQHTAADFEPPRGDVLMRNPVFRRRGGPARAALRRAASRPARHQQPPWQCAWRQS